MIITTDDFAPLHMGLFEKTWDLLHNEFPGMRLLAFTTWNYQNEGEVDKDKDFRKFCDVRASWLELAMHGYVHLQPEGLLIDGYPLDALKKRWENYAKRSECKIHLDYKPPYYKWNIRTLEVARDAGIKFFYVQDGILNLTTFEFYPRAVNKLIDTHTNLTTAMKDRIDVFLPELRKILQDESTTNIL